MTNDFNKELSAHSPSLADALGVRPGITAIIGSGGKTSLMRALSRELAAGGSRVLLTTTTHILPFKDMPCLRISMKEDASWVLDKLAGIKTPVQEICFGSGLLPGCGAGFVFPSAESTGNPYSESAGEFYSESAGKPYSGSAGNPYSGAAGKSASFNPKLSEPGFPLYELLPVADYILAEADGARHHYMKAHAHYEPVIPERCGRTILVVGAQGFGMRVSEAVHRPEIFCRLTGAQPGDIVTPALYAEFLRHEVEGGLTFDCVLLNGVDCERRRDLSVEFAAAFAGFLGTLGSFGAPVVFADLPLA